MSVDAPLPPPLATDAPEAPQAAASTPITEPVVRTKDGSVSKMRSHRGNIPTLPQTKFCPLCPAKFTRTTHLNRHLKTHSNERLHECNRCHAQFTRSDLLTRHKRTCCDASINRSRRKSCQSCADSKVRCDLQRPCSKCKARGRECVYANSPVAGSSGPRSKSKNESSSPEVAATPSGSSSHQDSPPETRSSPQSSTSPTAAAAPADLSFSPDIFDLTVFSSTSQGPSHRADALLGGTLPTNTLSGSAISTGNLATSNGAIAAFNPSASTQQNGQDGEGTAYTELFSSEIYHGLFSDLFTSSFQKNPLVPGQHFHQDPTAILTDRFEAAGIDPATMEIFYQTPAQLAIYPVPSAPPAVDPQSCIPEIEVVAPSLALTVKKPMPSVPEMYEFITSFLTTFTYHMPILHLPTFLTESRVHLLVKATKAAGAMYYDTQTATNYIDHVLSSVRDEIIAELSHTTDYDTIIQLTVASCLVQTIGMFHKDPDQRAKSNVYHGMIVMMLRMNGFVDKTRDWTLPEVDYSDPDSVQRSWREWARHESAKRALWVCYLHDCCHSIYFNISPTFTTEQFTLGLPCEDALWTAKDATEWALLLQTPSPYGPTEVRLCSHFLKALYSYMVQDNPTGEARTFIVSPFAHMVMIHAMMRKLFEMYLRDRLPFQQQSDGPGTPKLKPHFVNKDRVFHIQILLHCWLQSWLSSPDTPRDVPESQQRFLFNALPFYWLTQVGLVAYQEGLPPFDPEGVYISSHEAKFHLMKKWEKHIRKFLERGEEAPTMFWDEVMKMRTDTWQAESGFEYANLLGFFHLHD